MPSVNGSMVRTEHVVLQLGVDQCNIADICSSAILLGGQVTERPVPRRDRHATEDPSLWEEHGQCADKRLLSHEISPTEPGLQPRAHFS